MVTNSKPSFIGMSRTLEYGMFTSNAQRRSYTVKLNAHIVQISRNFINFSATKEMLISKQNLRNGSAFITFTGHMAPSTEKHLTKHSEKSYNQKTGRLAGNRTLHIDGNKPLNLTRSDSLISRNRDYPNWYSRPFTDLGGTSVNLHPAHKVDIQQG